MVACDSGVYLGMGLFSKLRFGSASIRKGICLINYKSLHKLCTGIGFIFRLYTSLYVSLDCYTLIGF